MCAGCLVRGKGTGGFCVCVCVQYRVFYSFAGGAGRGIWLVIKHYIQRFSLPPVSKKGGKSGISFFHWC